MQNAIDSTGSVPIEDIVVGLVPLIELTNKLLESDSTLTRQDALNEAFDHFCWRSGGRLVRGMDVFVGDDSFGHAYGWRVT